MSRTGAGASVSGMMPPSECYTRKGTTPQPCPLRSATFVTCAHLDRRG
jgi:hypothetical protein